MKRKQNKKKTWPGRREEVLKYVEMCHRMLCEQNTAPEKLEKRENYIWITIETYIHRYVCIYVHYHTYIRSYIWYIPLMNGTSSNVSNFKLKRTEGMECEWSLRKCGFFVSSAVQEILLVFGKDQVQLQQPSFRCFSNHIFVLWYSKRHVPCY